MIHHWSRIPVIWRRCSTERTQPVRWNEHESPSCLALSERPSSAVRAPRSGPPCRLLVDAAGPNLAAEAVPTRMATVHLIHDKCGAMRQGGRWATRHDATTAKTNGPLRDVSHERAIFQEICSCENGVQGEYPGAAGCVPRNVFWNMFCVLGDRVWRRYQRPNHTS